MGLGRPRCCFSKRRLAAGHKHVCVTATTRRAADWQRFISALCRIHNVYFEDLLRQHCENIRTAILVAWKTKHMPL